MVQIVFTLVAVERMDPNDVFQVDLETKSTTWKLSRTRSAQEATVSVESFTVPNGIPSLVSNLCKRRVCDVPSYRQGSVQWTLSLEIEYTTENVTVPIVS